GKKTKTGWASMDSVKGIVLDVLNRRRFNGEIIFNGQGIRSINEIDELQHEYILPGFTDAHIHIESSMLLPSEFARIAVRHGTVATVSDPHEIANVCGREGVDFMIDNSRQVPLKFFYGAPSCVPATAFESAGARLDAADVKALLDRDDIYYLAEMMNWPGVLSDDEEVMAKIKAALARKKPVDGHAPGLMGERAAKYASAGITTDHECFTKQEALDKLKNGMKIAIREGSAAKNFNALISLLGEFPGRIMFCSDDKHPDDLLEGHINLLVTRALNLGYDLFDTLYAGCVLPALHYNLEVGLLREGDPADFIIVDDPETMAIQQTWINGQCVFDHGQVRMPEVDGKLINNFTSWSTRPEDFVMASQNHRQPVIVAQDGELITGKSLENLDIINGSVQSDPGRDILKIVLVNRYRQSAPAVGFIKNFGIREGAIASSVAHDSHNIIAVGSSDDYLSAVVNAVMENKGGLAAANETVLEVLPLPVAGLMSDRQGEEVAAAYGQLSRMARQMGSRLTAPFMLISFMALLVIPSLKISDKGMFDAERFRFA
ncbi:MAG: adenine deaminase, partial [Balneolales bacterium]